MKNSGDKDTSDRSLWARFKSEVRPEKWYLSTDKTKLKTCLTFYPELNNEDFLLRNPNDPDVPGFAPGVKCVHYHRIITFEVKASPSPFDGYVQLSVKFKGRRKFVHPCGAKSKNVEVKDNCSSPMKTEPEVLCNQYFWEMSNCLIKISVLDRNHDIHSTRRLTTESELDLAYCPKFITITEMNSILRNRKFTFTEKNRFLPMVFDISAQIHLAGRDKFGKNIDHHYLQPYMIQNPSFYNHVGMHGFYMPPLATFVGKSDKLSPNDEECNITLEIDDGSETAAEIKVHKCVLLIKSEVFRNLLGGNWIESDTDKLKMFCSPVVATAFIDYFYDSLNNPEAIFMYDWDWPMYVEVFKLSHFYNVQDLIEFCIDWMYMDLKADYSLQKALDVLSMSNAIIVPDLIQRAIQTITQRRDAVIGSVFKMDDEERKLLQEFLDSPECDQSIKIQLQVVGGEGTF